MKIDNSLNSISPANPGGTGKSAHGDAAKPKAGVSVELSGLSSALGSAQAGGPVMDAARIADIKQAIAEGHFQVNSEVVADRLLQTVQELIFSAKR